MIKKNVVLWMVISLTLVGVNAMAEHKGHMDSSQPAAAAGSAHVHADVKKHHDCARCGMDRGRFDSSRMLITYRDGSTVGVCSIHCLAGELKKNKGKAVKSLEVADYDSRKLISAEKAFWVIGGDKNGVMTSTAKWAFARKADAEAFIRKSGGRQATYGEALALAEKE